jgi:hypothetical protein
MTITFDDNLFAAMMMVMVTAVDGVQDAVRCALEAAAERVVLTFVVVVTHLGSRVVDVVGVTSLLDVDGNVAGSPTFVLYVVALVPTSTSVTFGNVEFGVLVLVRTFAFEVDVELRVTRSFLTVLAALDFDVYVGVVDWFAVLFPVAVGARVSPQSIDAQWPV